MGWSVADQIWLMLVLLAGTWHTLDELIGGL